MIIQRALPVIFITLSLLFNACGLLKKGQEGMTPETAILLDTVDFVINADETLPYQQPADRTLNVLHMELDLRFNWEEEEVLGTAILTASPYFGALDTLTLDARGFEIKAVSWNQGDSSYSSAYQYDGEKLHLIPTERLRMGDTTKFTIDYIARPTRLEKGDGRAITSAQGLYFINPRKELEGKPTQIWSQGETTYNSGWFPCVDEPHEKFTQEIFLTVDTSLQTLSNGAMMYQSLNEDGTRTDYWKQDQPHSTYLTMIAIGSWAVHKDAWRDMPVWYYVDQEYAEDAAAIFGNTPEMLSFYSEVLGVDYPWAKYHQVVVEDFVSGAMENTSAVIHGDFVQLTQRELIDESHEDVIAHELFHHWFGDLVTCESWPQITMNEGFATYGEYLWKAHKYGLQHARYHLHKDAQRYFTDAEMRAKPLIRYRYDTPDDLFDSHSYQKGGLVIHMLRTELGDDAFFKGLTHYLNKHAFGTVEDDELRQSMEELSGLDLRWFFDDWYNMAGHPEMKIRWEHDSAWSQLRLNLSQEQESERPFRQHASVVVAYPTSIDTHRVWVDEWNEQFTFNLSTKPLWYAVDPEHDLLWERDAEKPEEAWLAQLEQNITFHPLNDAMAALKPDSEARSERLQSALFEMMRSERYFEKTRYGAVEQLFGLSDLDTTKALAMLNACFADDASSHVRSVALFAMDSLLADGLSLEIIERALNDTSFKVMRSALSLMLERDPCKGLSFTETFSSEEKAALITWLSRLHATCGAAESLPFFQTAGNDLSGFERFLFNNDFGNYAQVAGTEAVYDTLVKQLSKEALSETSWWARLAALQSLEKAERFYASEVDSLEAMPELTSDETERLAMLRNKKASLSALMEEARELQGDDEHFID